MTLTDIAKTGWNKVKKVAKPVLKTAAGVVTIAALTFMTPKISSAQIEADTLWATGILTTKNAETGDPLGGVNVQMRPHMVQMYTPDTVFHYTTSANGLAQFSVYAYLDSITSISESYLKKNTKAYVSNNKLNIELPKNINKGVMSIFSINGQKLGEYQINNKTSLSLEHLANAMYLYRINTDKGTTSNKFTKLGVGTTKEDKANRDFKSTQMYTAQYWVKWSKEDFKTDSTLVTLEDGNNGFLFLQVEPDGGSGETPQYQYIGGTIRDDNNNKVNNALVRIKVGGNVFAEMYTDSQGKFQTPNPIPTGTEFEFDAVGGIAGKFSFSGDESSTIDQVINPNDTLRLVYNYHLPERSPRSTRSLCNTNRR